MVAIGAIRLLVKRDTRGGVTVGTSINVLVSQISQSAPP